MQLAPDPEPKTCARLVTLNACECANRAPHAVPGRALSAAQKPPRAPPIEDPAASQSARGRYDISRWIFRICYPDLIGSPKRPLKLSSNVSWATGSRLVSASAPASCDRDARVRCNHQSIQPVYRLWLHVVVEPDDWSGGFMPPSVYVALAHQRSA